jgi:hypothetical protein
MLFVCGPYVVQCTGAVAVEVSLANQTAVAQNYNPLQVPVHIGKRLVNRPSAGAWWSGILEECRKPNQSIGAN